MEGLAKWGKTVYTGRIMDRLTNFGVTLAFNGFFVLLVLGALSPFIILALGAVDPGLADHLSSWAFPDPDTEARPWEYSGCGTAFDGSGSSPAC